MTIKVKLAVTLKVEADAIDPKQLAAAHWYAETAAMHVLVHGHNGGAVRIGSDVGPNPVASSADELSTLPGKADVVAVSKRKARKAKRVPA